MNALQDRRILVAAGAAAALVAGLAIAMFFMNRDKPAATAPVAGQLQVEVGQEAPRVDPSRPLRCFVGGQFIGLATLSDCAQRNGVAAQSLDVGLDESGELAAGGELAPLQPLPEITPPQPVTIAEPPAAPPVQEAAAGLGECLRFGGDGWRAVGGGMTLNACVQILFDGRCQRPGEALYGRWAGQSLRLVPGRVETSPDNRSFSTLAEQGSKLRHTGGLIVVAPRRLALVLAAVATGLAACEGPSLSAPVDPGVCWHMVRVEGKYRFNKLASDQPQLEHCAARLEDMRLRFMRLGSQQTEVVGAYQGQFIFLQQEGVFTSRSLNATPYLALVRTGDGRLAMPGAIKQ